MDEAEKARRLRLLESAAASAILNGATPDEVWDRVETGVNETLESATYKAMREREAAAA